MLSRSFQSDRFATRFQCPFYRSVSSARR